MFMQLRCVIYGNVNDDLCLEWLNLATGDTSAEYSRRAALNAIKFLFQSTKFDSNGSIFHSEDHYTKTICAQNYTL